MTELLQAHQCYNGYGPLKGPLSVRTDIDLTAVTNYTLDLSRLVENRAIDFFQTIYVDNSANAQALTITPLINLAPYRIPAGAQAILPLAVSNPAKIQFGTLGAVSIPVVLYSVPLPAVVWGDDNSSDIIAVLEDILADLDILTADQRGTYTDNSGTTTGASVQVFAANAARKRILIQAGFGNAASIFVNFGAAATTAGDSIELVPGGSYDSGSYPVSTQSINILGTNPDTYMAKEMA